MSIMLCRKLALYTECRYAECRYAECHYAECRGAMLPTEPPSQPFVANVSNFVSTTSAGKFIKLLHP